LRGFETGEAGGLGPVVFGCCRHCAMCAL
jgi:hypothetical protein